MSKYAYGVLVMFCLLVCGCVQPAKTWVSDPEQRYFERSQYEIKVIPQKEDSPSYNRFFLEIKNLGQENIEIDWNKSIYIYKGRNGGRFVFKGIDPKRFKNATVPPDTIYPDQILSKEIGPFRFVAFETLKYRQQHEKSALSFGMLPKGENGVILVLRIVDKEIRERFIFSFVPEQSQ